MTNIRVIFAPDPQGNPVAVASSADDDGAMEAAFSSWMQEAVTDPLWGHLHPRLRDPEAFASAQEIEAGKHEWHQALTGHALGWTKMLMTRDKDGRPYIGIWYEVLPFVGADNAEGRGV